MHLKLANHSGPSSYLMVDSVHIELQVLQAIKGSRKAQMKLYDLHWPAMYGTSCRLVNNPQDAEELVHEAFLIAFKRLAQLEEPSRFSGWLKRIVINESLQFLRKKSTSVIHEEIDFDIPDVANASAVNLSKELNTVKLAMKQMPVGYHTVATLFWFEGLSHQEISEHLSITASSSRSQLARAKQFILNFITKTEVCHGSVDESK